VPSWETLRDTQDPTQIGLSVPRTKAYEGTQERDTYETHLSKNIVTNPYTTNPVKGKILLGTSLKPQHLPLRILSFKRGWMR
jgi:hypothetical protein